MYKSPAAKTAKDLIAQLKELRQSHNLALEDGRYEDAQEFLERQENLERQLDRLRTGWDRSSSPVVTADDIAEVVRHVDRRAGDADRPGGIRAPAADGRGIRCTYHRST